MVVNAATVLEEVAICLGFGAMSMVKIFEKIKKISKLYEF